MTRQRPRRKPGNADFSTGTTTNPLRLDVGTLAGLPAGLAARLVTIVASAGRESEHAVVVRCDRLAAERARRNAL